MPSTAEQEERLDLLRRAFFPETETEEQECCLGYDCCPCHSEDEVGTAENLGTVLGTTVLDGMTFAVEALLNIIEDGTTEQIMQAANLLLGYSVALSDRGLS